MYECSQPEIVTRKELWGVANQEKTLIFQRIHSLFLFLHSILTR